MRSRRYYRIKGIIYVALGVGFTPLVLSNHPIMMAVQASVFTVFGILYIAWPPGTSKPGGQR